MSLDDRARYEGDDIIAPFGQELLRRTPDGAIVRWATNGHTTPLVPAACAGRLVHADPERQSVLVSCIKEERVECPLWVFRPDGGHDLHQRFCVERDSWGEEPAHVVALGPLHVDMDAVQIVAARPFDAGEVRVVDDHTERAKGAYAERSDRMLLRGQVADPASYRGISVGPLRWRR